MKNQVWQNHIISYPQYFLVPVLLLARGWLWVIDSDPFMQLNIYVTCCKTHNYLPYYACIPVCPSVDCGDVLFCWWPMTVEANMEFCAIGSICISGESVWNSLQINVTIFCNFLFYTIFRPIFENDNFAYSAFAIDGRMIIGIAGNIWHSLHNNVAIYVSFWIHFWSNFELFFGTILKWILSLCYKLAIEE